MFCFFLIEIRTIFTVNILKFHTPESQENGMCKQYRPRSDCSYTVCIPLSILRNNCIKSKIYAKKVWNKVFEVLGHLP